MNEQNSVNKSHVEFEEGTWVDDEACCFCNYSHRCVNVQT